MRSLAEKTSELGVPWFSYLEFILYFCKLKYNLHIIKVQILHIEPDEP